MATRRRIPRELLRQWSDAMSGADPLAALSATRALRSDLGERERTLVAEAMAAGASWDDVAGALGISRQAAWRKFRAEPERDTATRAARDREAAAVRMKHRTERRELRERQQRELGRLGRGSS